MRSPDPLILAVHASTRHEFSKHARAAITLLAGLGVEGDAHCGRTVQHRSRVAKDPDQPNLRQVHLIHAELLEQLAAAGHPVAPGALGENITTRGVDLLGLPVGTRLHLGRTAVVTLTGLRNPCAQIERFQTGLLGEVLEKRPDGSFLRKAGVMGVVSEGGEVAPGDAIRIEWPAAPHQALSPV